MAQQAVNLTVEVFVTLRQNSTGAEVTFRDEVAVESLDESPWMFNYEEGNWSCDCNRVLDWERAGGDMSAVDEGTDGVCLQGDHGTGQFSALIKDANGKKLFGDGYFL